MVARSKGNPFAQSAKYWKVNFILPEAVAKQAEEAFTDMALAVSAFETDEAKKLWTFELLFGDRPDMADIQRRLMLLSALQGAPVPAVTSEPVEQKDWLAQVAKSFPPLAIGRFFIHGSHVTEAPPAGSIVIRVDAGAAFGSGEHGTTRRCLEALEWLGRKRNFSRILDMGCGSGILAIAAAKLWKADVLAVDIDPVAVRVAQANVQANREQARVSCAVSDGYSAKAVQRAGRFDLIVSNILARPLIAFAPDLNAHLAPGGVAVLSGLLTSQEAPVLSAHLMQGLKLEKRFVHGEWLTLALRR